MNWMHLFAAILGGPLGVHVLTSWLLVGLAALVTAVLVTVLYIWTKPTRPNSVQSIPEAVRSQR